MPYHRHSVFVTATGTEFEALPEADLTDWKSIGRVARQWKGMTPTGYLLLGKLHELHGLNGIIYASMQTMADAIGACRTAVRTAIDDAERCGILERTTRKQITEAGEVTQAANATGFAYRAWMRSDRDAGPRGRSGARRPPPAPRRRRRGRRRGSRARTPQPWQEPPTATPWPPLTGRAPHGAGHTELRAENSM